MSLPKSYLTSFKNTPAILKAIQNGQAPSRFTTRFLESLGFKTPADRLIIGVLKSIGFLGQNGEPTPKYFEFLDQTQGPKVLAQALRDAYAELFQINTKAYELSATDIKNKLKTLTQGQYSDSVLDKMAGTFKALSQLADFSNPASVAPASEQPAEKEPPREPEETLVRDLRSPLRIGGLVYTINIALPESREQAVYDALFKSLKEHLLQ